MYRYWNICFVLILLAAVVPACSTEKSVPEGKNNQGLMQKEEAGAVITEKVTTSAKPETNGEALFMQHCVKCHRNGGNIINRDKPITGSALRENNITTAEDIVRVMRNPGPKMKIYSEEQVPDSQALKIGEYILETFR